MICPKCGSTNVITQAINEVKIKNKHHGFFWWLLVSWWWIPIKWLVFTLPALLVALFGKKRQKAVNKQKTVCVCQDCGYRWDLK